MTLVKRIFDIVASFLGLVIVSPAILVVAMLIKIKTTGPVFFCQKRIGRYGQPFILYKFRTMIANHGGDSISLKGEGRITPLGAILRKYKIDELPELWNVLRGDMSFVGPRPDVSEYTGKLSGEELKILQIRPGITSPASLKYYDEEELIAAASDPKRHYEEAIWPDKVRINMEYCDNRSFFGDILIIVETIFRRRGLKQERK